VQDLVVFEDHHECGVEPLRDRRTAHRRGFVRGRAEALLDRRHRGAALRGLDAGRLDGHLAVHRQGLAERGYGQPEGQCNYGHLQGASKHVVVSYGRDSAVAAIYAPVWQSQPLSPGTDSV
jgi:hypothetical protein